jgi:hypothetical protein
MCGKRFKQSQYSPLKTWLRECDNLQRGGPRIIAHAEK